MTDDDTRRLWADVGTLAGELLAAVRFLEQRPAPGAAVRADMRAVLARALACPPAHCALIGLRLLIWFQNDTGSTIFPSGDGGPELAAFREVIDAITQKLDAAANDMKTIH